MGDSAINRSGLVYRTAKFFNNKSFSDFQFLVKDGSSCTCFYAHKLILVMASEDFERYFSKEGSSENKRIIDDFTPEIVYLTLQYLYTDELEFTHVKEAMDVYRFASKFGIKELIEKCKDYIGLDRITEDNVFLLYDIALKDRNMKELLYKCQDLIRRKTPELLVSVQFCNASVDVLKDILNQNTLAVDTELTIINAVLRWCKQDCVRRGQPTDANCVRDSISPFLPYLRFLTLSLDELFQFVEDNSIFTSPESVMLTRKIISPDSECKIPVGFCPNTTPRVKINTNGFKPDPIISVPPKVSGNAVDHRLSLKDTFGPEVKNEPLWTIKQPQQDFAVSRELYTQHSSIFSFPPKGGMNENSNTKRITVHNPSPTEFPKKSPMLKIVPTFTAKKLFEFPLQEIHRGISSVSLSDVKCSAEIQVSRGKIVIYGIELKVLSLPHRPDDVIKVGLSISGDCPETELNKLITLKNNLMPFSFSEPVSLNSSDSAKIEVTIEDLKLSRCYVCRQASNELNMGLNLATVIKLKSNQSNEGDGFLFLISRIIYS